MNTDIQIAMYRNMTDEELLNEVEYQTFVSPLAGELARRLRMILDAKEKPSPSKGIAAMAPEVRRG